LYADTILMKHSVDEKPPFALKEIAGMKQREIGLDEELAADAEQQALKDNVLSKGGSWTKFKKDMYMGDLPILGRYGCSDVDLTLRIFHYYLKEIKKEGLLDFFFIDEVMPLYKEVTIPMEDRGVRVDIPLIKSVKDPLMEDMKKLEEEVQRLLEPINGPIIDKLLNSDKAGNVKITGSGLKQALARRFEIPLEETKTGGLSLGKKSLERAKDLVTDDLQRMILSFYETLEVPEALASDFVAIQKELYIEKARKKKPLTRFVFNLSSGTQMKELCFGILGLKPLAYTDKKQPKCDADFLDSIADKFDWSAVLHQYNKLNKLKGTYIDRLLDSNLDAIFYPSFKQHGTISGRYGSDIQQLPKPPEKKEGVEFTLVESYTDRVREFFIARPGYKFIDADYESLEPHVFSHCSTDEKIQDIFHKGHDFYSTIAIDVEGLTHYSADKKAENYLGKLNKSVRSQAKPYSLGIPYGMTPYALAMALGIKPKEGEVKYDNYFKSYKKLHKWYKDSRRQAQMKGFVTSEVGRVRHLNKVRDLHKIHGDRLLDFKYRRTITARFSRSLGAKEAEKEVTRMYMDYKNELNNATNFQIQSLAASIVNRAAIAVVREFAKQNIDGFVIAQIHDQLIFEVADKDVETAKKIVKDKMENTTKLSIDLKAPPEISLNFKEGH